MYNKPFRRNEITIAKNRQTYFAPRWGAILL